MRSWGLWLISLGYSYDCIFIGSSPFSLLEALNRIKEGKQVLVLEEASRAGGAWASIDVCGLTHVDAACHFLNADPDLIAFLTSYVGCRFENDYFANGCHELIDHLASMVKRAGGNILLKTTAKEVLFENNTVFVHTTSGVFATDTLIVTPMSRIVFPQAGQKEPFYGSEYYHLFLLFDEAPHVTYQQGGVLGARRMMRWGHVLILQTEELPLPAELYVEALRNEGWISPTASLLASDFTTYSTGACHAGFIQTIHAEEHIQMLQTGTFSKLARYIKLLEPYKEFAYKEKDD
jgi:hypothetical protein